MQECQFCYIASFSEGQFANFAKASASSRSPVLPKHKFARAPVCQLRASFTRVPVLELM